MARKRPKYHQRQAIGKPVSLAPSPWDFGATGPANRAGLEIEDAADIDPETGEVINPNNVKRARRASTADEGFAAGLLTKAHVMAARELKALNEGGVMGGGDPLAAIVIKSPGGSPFEPQAALFDARRKFHAVWRRIPVECSVAIERFIISDMSEAQAFGKKMCDVLDGYAKIRVGLKAAFGVEE